MFFLASKILWILVSPVNLALLGALVGAWLARRRPFWGRALSTLGLGFLLVAGFLPLGMAMIRPLENRFPVPPSDAPAPYGIIILGGAIEDDVGAARGQVVLADGASRLTEAAMLARRFPKARIIYTGGSPSVLNPESDEANQARALLLGLGLEPERLAIEKLSRNTDENARFTADMVKPTPGQTWWLVTSAFHMPRSMGLFRKAGFDVVAYPVDYRSQNNLRDFKPIHDPVEGLKLFNLAIHEWVGLVAYRAAGKIDEGFPAP